MKIFYETSLWSIVHNEMLWSEGQTNAEIFTPAELDEIEETFNEIYPEGIDLTTLNDIFRFDIEQVASQIMGYEEFAKRMNWDISDLNQDIWELPF